MTAVRPTSRAGIEEQNSLLLDRYRQFRIAADVVAAALRTHPHVLAIALIGSVARDPWKEVPRFSPYRRARVELWHECKDLDLAIWLSNLSDLNALRRRSAAALRKLMERARHRRCGPPGRCLHPRTGNRPLSGTALRLQRLSERQARMPRSRLRRCAVPAPARGFRLVAGHSCAGSGGPPVRPRFGNRREGRRPAAAGLKPRSAGRDNDENFGLILPPWLAGSDDDAAEPAGHAPAGFAAVMSVREPSDHVSFPDLSA